MHRKTTAAEHEGIRTARESLELVRSGATTSQRLLADRLEVIEATEADIHAWAHLDRDRAFEQARRADALADRDEARGGLHGVALGIKDNLDTADMPTERGCIVYADRRPSADAAVVERLRTAGAVILGKTVCTELAWMQPAATRNPYDSSRTPGGSSSGSAAAVGAGHVPLAVGSQTGGSVIRPASFCGVVGFKPSAGIISRRGMFETSPTLDQVGVFGADVADVALLADVLAGRDPSDPVTHGVEAPRMLEACRLDPPRPPRLAWFDMPYADRYSRDMALRFEDLLATLGDRVRRIAAPDSFASMIGYHKAIYEFEISRCLEDLREHHIDRLGEVTRTGLVQAAQRSESDYHEALAGRTQAIDWFAEFFGDFDAVITPSALGEAPHLEEGTGDPVCCSVWTLCGLPCVSLPLLTGASGLPIGVQLVGAAFADDALVQSARWLAGRLQPAKESSARSLK